MNFDFHNPYTSTRLPVFARNVVSTSHPLAAQAGARILGQGGNVFDAVGAVASALNVVEPFMSSLAGMGSAIMWVAAESRVRVLDFVPLGAIRHVFSAKVMRDSSPPDATCASGRGGSPGFAAIRNTTRSMPRAVQSGSPASTGWKPI